MREERQRIAGRLEATLRVPDVPATAIVVIAHPLPTHGGSMRNPLIAALARAAADRGWYALRFNFRGVGESAGTWSGGEMEHLDLADAVSHARDIDLPVGVVGFSFGAATILRWLATGGQADALVLLGLPLDRKLPPVPAGAVVINGDRDEFGAAAEVRRRSPQAIVIAVPDSDHFFTGKRDQVARIVMEQLALTLP